MASRINVIRDFSIREIFDADIRMVDIQVFVMGITKCSDVVF